MDLPRLFYCALPLAGYVSAATAIAANAAAARSSHFRFEPARKNTLAVSHRSFDVVLSAAKGYVKQMFFSYPCDVEGGKPNQTHRFDFKNAIGRAQKSRRRERWKTARIFARVVTRPEGTAQRRDFAAIAGAPET